ncbi:hypothetical protein ABFV58_34055, partial [Pseudomonas protegens]|uniref:hypothetical protein n=1 Tax=Pseudomonas protegens TaxID=380021 RepID=UPI0034D44E40
LLNNSNNYLRKKSPPAKLDQFFKTFFKRNISPTNQKLSFLEKSMINDFELSRSISNTNIIINSQKKNENNIFNDEIHS